MTKWMECLASSYSDRVQLLTIGKVHRHACLSRWPRAFSPVQRGSAIAGYQDWGRSSWQARRLHWWGHPCKVASTGELLLPSYIVVIECILMAILHQLISFAHSFSDSVSQCRWADLIDVFSKKVASSSLLWQLVPREWVSPAAVTFLVQRLLEEGHQFPRELEAYTIYVMPMANPDG